MNNPNEFDLEDTLSQDYAEKIQMDFDKKRKMISDDSYIRWLEDFTNTHPEFSSEDWLYNPQKISNEDYKKVANLDLFFRAISDYAEEHCLESEFDNTGFNDIYFFIKFNDIAYRIGLIVGQGAYAYCNRLDSIPNHYINFNNVLANKGRDDMDIVQEKFNDLSNLVKSLRELKVPKRSIRDVVERAF